MSNRFYQKFYLRCEKCGTFTQRAQGYKPIANPMLFNSDEHCSNFHMEQRRATGMSGLLCHNMCSGCQRVHPFWKVVDHQAYLDSTLTLRVAK